MGSPGLEVTFVNETNSEVDLSLIKKHLELILRRLRGADRLSIEVVLVGDERIKQLNSKYRSKDTATDVLSFEAPNDTSAGLLGSVVVSIDTATRQAKEAGITLQDEIKMLSGHGFLHLLGYHHK